MNPNINLEIEVTLLPSHDGNRQSMWWRSCRRSHEISKTGKLPCVHDQFLPTSQKPIWKQSAETCSDKSTKKSYRQVKSAPRGKSTKSIKILLKRPTESVTLKWIRWSPKRTSKDDYPVNQHLRVNATYRWLPAAQYILHSMLNHCTELRER
jgi:hypothetical protein